MLCASAFAIRVKPNSHGIRKNGSGTSITPAVDDMNPLVVEVKSRSFSVRRQDSTGSVPWMRATRSDA